MASRMLGQYTADSRKYTSQLTLGAKP